MIDTSGRQSKRTPVTLKIKFKSATLEQFIERYSVDVSHGGIFIRTKDPLAVGTQLRFEFQLQDASPLISGEGTVVWTREFDPSRVGVAPGMGVRFDKLGPDSQGVLDRILARKHKDAGEPKFEGPLPQAATKITPPGLAGTLAAQARTPTGPVVRPSAAAAPQPAHKQTMLGLGTPERPVPRVGHLAPPRGGFPEEPSKDATPLPKPMPFHAVADDEFSDDVFDQPTKVASLEDLLRHEEMQARAAREAEEDRTPSPDTDPMPAHTWQGHRAEIEGAAAGVPRHPIKDDSSDAKTSVKRREPSGPIMPSALGRPPTPLGVAKATPRSQPIQTQDDSEPRFLREGSRPLTRPSSSRAAVPAIVEPKSSFLPLALTAAIGLLGAAAAIYFFVIRPNEEPPHTRPNPVAETARPAPAPAPAPPSPTAPTVAVAVTSSPSGATILVDGESRGQTPGQVDGLSPDKTYQLALKAPCYKEERLDLQPAADKPVDRKLTPLDRVVRIATEPDGARVLVNGKVVGRAPAEVKMGPTPPTVRATLPGYAASELTVPTDAQCATEGNFGVINVKLTLAKTPEPPARPAAARPTPAPPPAAAPAKPAPAKPQPSRARPVIVSPLQPVPGLEAPKEKPAEAPTEKPPEPTEKPAEKAPEPPPPAEPPKPAAEPPAETPKEKPAEAPAPASKKKERIAPPKEQPLPSKECDPSPDAPEWARCK